LPPMHFDSAPSFPSARQLHCSQVSDTARQSLSAEHVAGAVGTFGSTVPGVTPPVPTVVAGGAGGTGGGGVVTVVAGGGGGGGGPGGGGGGGGLAGPPVVDDDDVPPIWARATHAPNPKMTKAMRGRRWLDSNMRRSIARLSPGKRRSSPPALKDVRAPSAVRWR
jgi:hypothetical protein